MKRAHLRNLQRSIAEAAKQAQLAYQFSPNSYTCSALIACLQADKMLRAATPTSSSSLKTAGCDTAQRLEHGHPRSEARGSTSTEQSVDPQPAGTKGGTEGAGGRPRQPQQIQAPVTHRTWCHEARQHREGETGRGAGMSLSPATAQKTSRRTVSQDAD
jgi:hypothetical protein